MSPVTTNLLVSRVACESPLPSKPNVNCVPFPLPLSTIESVILSFMISITAELKALPTSSPGFSIPSNAFNTI